jgi:hypothetical protein
VRLGVVVVAWPVASLVVVSPDRSLEWLADTKADANADADDEKDNGNLQNNAVSAAHASHAAAATLLLGQLGLEFHLLLARPDRAVAFPMCRQRAIGGVGVVQLEVAGARFQIRIEGVDAAVRLGKRVLAPRVLAGSGIALSIHGEGHNGGRIRQGRFLGKSDVGRSCDGVVQAVTAGRGSRSVVRGHDEDYDERSSGDVRGEGGGAKNSAMSESMSVLHQTMTTLVSFVAGE